MSIFGTATQSNAVTRPMSDLPLAEHGVRISGEHRGVRISGQERGVRISGRHVVAHRGVRISGESRGVRIR